jgi:hypothetical protein
LKFETRPHHETPPRLVFNDRLSRVAQEFAQQHLADQKLPEDQKRPYTLLIGMRSWLFEAFRDLRRVPPVGEKG